MKNAEVVANLERAYKECQQRAQHFNLQAQLQERPRPKAVVERKRYSMAEVKVGSHVVYHNPSGVAHQAVVTAVWSQGLINLVYVSSDEARTDTYGRQTERATSCHHKSAYKVHGNYWRFPEEEPNLYEAPQAV